MGDQLVWGMISASCVQRTFANKVHCEREKKPVKSINVRAAVARAVENWRKTRIRKLVSRSSLQWVPVAELRYKDDFFTH